MNETVLRDENDNIIKVPYFEIGNYAEAKVNEYIVNNHLEKDFEEFKKNYTVYKPYFDYLITKMHYKIENPFIFSIGVLEGKNNRFSYKNLLEYNYPTASDKDLMISKFNVNNISDEIIEPTGLSFKIDRTNDVTHEAVYEVILMEQMIYNKKLYEDYINCVLNDSNTYYDINVYFRTRLGYSQITVYDDNYNGFILSNPDIAPEYIQNVVRSIENMYPNMQSKYEGSQRYRNRK